MVEEAARWIEGLAAAGWLRRSPTAYLLVNATHVLGLGTMLGAILPLDLRLLGFFRSVPLTVVGPFLSRAAATGLALAVVTGLALFGVKPAEYLGNPAFLAKLALLALALANVVLQHRLGLRDAFRDGRVGGGARVLAGFSAALWLGVLVAGRAIGFV